MTVTATSSHLANMATRAAGFQPSPVRAVFDVSMQPGMISLAGGNPYLPALPLEGIAELARGVVLERGLEALQYGSGAGTEELQALICQVMKREGISAAPENIQVTAGSQMALELVTKLFCDPGDVVIAEGPTYVGALGVFEGFQAEVAHVAMDDDGVDPEHLQQLIAGLKAAGKTIKFFYTIPNFNNPSGISLSLERRQRVVDVCRAEDVLIVEDNPYGLLAFDGAPAPALHSLDPDNVLYLGSFSKIFAPGLRVGWVVAPEDVRGRLQIASEATTICPSVLSQLIVENYISSYDWRGQIEAYSSVYASRCRATLDALAAHMPDGTHWTTPAGGFFTWVTLPEGIDTEQVLAAAIDSGVVFVPGSAFYADGGGANQLRIAFSYADEEQLSEGVRRLGEAIRGL
ncbi:PLP-dependent aminotransferase family protein [Arthrobacter silvisoli]|uniref:aminotransferase-like domain-containing protein n=1 Tax=Arthrobacter silvisoli TaxID=2291022 RepID=UPI000E20E71A|nr:PLP-dependent aminotransferase family protein [Arthrobacter silvisoli]